MQLGTERDPHGDRWYGVYLRASRFNHSCRLNVSRSYDREKGLGSFRAYEAIKEGEELIVYYVDSSQIRMARQVELFRAFDFVCQCDVCSLEGAQARAVDARRWGLTQIFHDIYAQHTEMPVSELQKVDPLETVKSIRLALWILCDDKLHPGRVELAYAGAALCIGWRDAGNAKKWLRRLLEYVAIESGEDSLAYRQMAPSLQTPEKTPAWGEFGIKTLVGP